jgi:molecular chaperone GrpE
MTPSGGAGDDPGTTDDLPESLDDLHDDDTDIVDHAVTDAEVLDHLDADLDVAVVTAERDEFRDALLRVKADFDNYKKRIAKDHADTVARAAEGLVQQLLPVLDACEAALVQGITEVEPVSRQLVEVLTQQGLEVLAAEGDPFDPNLHEAVMHEPGAGGEPTVAGIMRAGYAWKGRVIRPALVKVSD